MAPPSADLDIVNSQELPLHSKDAKETSTKQYPTPLKYSGSLDDYEQFDVTAVIGREFPKLQLSEILNNDAKIRDLAITGSIILLLLLLLIH
jgi:hypothetical protein